MSTLDRKQKPRTLLIIAPTLYQCHRTATEHGLNPPAIENFRNVTRAHQLRGITAGTPFITYGRECWVDTPEGFDLDEAVGVYQRTGKLRIAQPDDLAACNPFGSLPSRPASAAPQRAGL